MTKFDALFLGDNDGLSYNDHRAAQLLLDSHILEIVLGYLSDSVMVLRERADQLHPKIAVVQAFYNEGPSLEMIKQLRPHMKDII